VQFTHRFAYSSSAPSLTLIFLPEFQEDKKFKIYLDGNPLAAVLALDHVLDDRVAGAEHLVHCRDAVEREADAEEVDYFVEEGPGWVISGNGG